MYRPLNVQDVLLICGISFVVLVSLVTLLWTFPSERKLNRLRKKRRNLYVTSAK